MKERGDMKEKIKVIIKRPGEKDGREVTIENTLRAFQELVGGYIETVPAGSGEIVICNEEGKNRNLQKNFILGMGFPFIDVICGTAVICGTDGDEFDDVPFSLELWRGLLAAWEN